MRRPGDGAIRTGDQLHNGAIVLAAQGMPNGEFVVLALRDDEFVTWVVDTGEAFWGHYFNAGSLRAALDDFEDRAGVTR